MTLPVLIAGAGPVGLTAALSLHQHGVPLRIIDRLPERTRHSRAAGITPRAMEVWERLGVLEPMLRQGVRIKGMRVTGAQGRELVRAPVEAPDSAYGFMLGLGQDETERILTEALAARGVQVERPVELTTFSQDGVGVCATLRDRDGDERIVEASYLIGCDGAHSTVRRTLGIPMEGESHGVQWQTADVRIDWEHDGQHMFLNFSENGFAFIMPIDDGRWRVALGVQGVRVDKPEDLTLAFMQELLTDKLHVQARLHDANWLAPFNINTRMAPKLQIGRVFIGGDACHVHSPLGGQGMNTGMQDVYNLTWKLAHVIKGHAPQSLLDSYAVERHANAQRLLQLLGTITKAATLHEPLAIWLRNTLMNVANTVGAGAMMARRLSQLDTHYRDSPVVAEHCPTLHGWLHATVSGAVHAGITDVAEFKQGPRPGERAPDVLNLRDAGGGDLRLFQSWLGDTRYQCLIFTGSHPKSERLADLRGLCERIDGAAPGLIRTTIVRHPAMGGVLGLHDAAGIAHRRYGASYECLYLVRPDGYIAFRSQPVEWAPLMDYLNQHALAPGVLRAGAELVSG